MHRSATRAIAVFLLFALAGCSLLYSYGNIDRYIRWSLGDYVDWDSAQEAQLRARLAVQLEWHRETQLPRYRDWLQSIDRMLDGDVDAQKLGVAADQLQSFWQGVAAHAADDTRAQLASLSDSQVNDLLDMLREKQADLKGEYDDMTQASLEKRRKREMTKAIKYWLGTVDKHQAGLINAWARQVPDSRSLWLDNRERWTREFAQALQHRHERDVFAAKIHRLFVTPEESWSAELRELTRKNRESTLGLIAELHNASTQRQRAAEHKRVAQWLVNLDRLAMD